MTIPKLRKLLNTHDIKTDHLTDTQIQQMGQILAFGGIRPPKTPNELHHERAAKDPWYWQDRLL